jgi:FtsP/CotA-like multicopper oxidase with cupredoxin domain
MRFNVATQSADDVTLYSSLPANADINQRIPAASATAARNFVLNTVGMMQFAINSKLFDVNRIDELVSSGATEVWTISNATGMAHPFHAHAIQWQVLDRSSVPANGVDLGWKDTVLVQPGETVRIIGRFDPIINKGLYMYHCHILEHEEAGMMGTFFIQ